MRFIIQNSAKNMDKIAVINLLVSIVFARSSNSVELGGIVKDENRYHRGVVVQFRIVINKTRNLFLI